MKNPARFDEREFARLVKLARASIDKQATYLRRASQVSRVIEMRALYAIKAVALDGETRYAVDLVRAYIQSYADTSTISDKERPRGD